MFEIEITVKDKIYYEKVLDIYDVIAILTKYPGYSSVKVVSIKEDKKLVRRKNNVKEKDI